MSKPRSLLGYTVIELVIVIGVMVTLMAMSAPALVGALQKSRMQRSSANVLAVHDQAQLHAMSRYAPSDNSHFGVVLVQDPGERAWVALISSTPGNGPFRSKILLNSRSEPISRFYLPQDVDVWLAGQPLWSTATREIAWFCQYRSGLPITMSASGPGRQPANIGAAANVAGSSGSPLFGLTIAGSPFILSSASIAPESGSNPGLSLRGKQLRQAITIYSSGLTQVVEF